jgi:hypothetical protein
MEWIQRNPKKTVALSALAVLVVVVIVWGIAGGGGSPKSEPTLGGSPLATPTATPTHTLSALPTPSGVPTSVGQVLNALPGAGATGATGVFGAGGSSKSLARHHVTVTAHSDGPMMAVGWWIPFADGDRKGGKKGPGRSFTHSDGTYGDGDLARILAYGGPYSTKTWCTVTVDGKVTDRQQARGPYAEVFCQG